MKQLFKNNAKLFHQGSADGAIDLSEINSWCHLVAVESINGTKRYNDVIERHETKKN